MWHSWLFEIKEQSRWGAVWLRTPNTQHAAGPVRRKKEHNWIRYQNKVSVCFNYSSDTVSSWKHWEPAERENERKRKRWSKREWLEGRGKGGKERERAAGVSGPQAVAGSWTRGWRGELSGRCLAFQSSVSGLRTEWTMVTSTITTQDKYVPELLCLQILQQRESMKAMKLVYYFWRIVWIL